MTTKILPVTLDTYLQSGYVTTNYSSSAIIATGERNTGASKERSIIKITGLTDEAIIPKSARIKSAILTLTAQEDLAYNARTHRWYRMKRSDISIAQCTWNVFKTGSNWQTAGGFGADDCEQTDIGNANLPDNLAANYAQDFILSASAIQEIVNGTWTVNYLLGKADTENNEGYHWHSSEATNEAYRPYLTLIYSIGSQIIIF